MWTWTLNWNEIRDDLVIGACPMTTRDIDRIHKESGATALLSLQTDKCRRGLAIDYEAHKEHGKRSGLVLLNAPMRDFDPPDQRRRLPHAVACLNSLLSDGHKVYVHCTAGINRAPLTVLGYLTFVETMPKAAAYQLILRGRPEAEPYWEAYNGYYRDLLDRYRNDIRRRAFTISLLHPEHNKNQNWQQAKNQVIPDAVLGPRPKRFRRPDPKRT